jgi:hypothetical protein
MKEVSAVCAPLLPFRAHVSLALGKQEGKGVWFDPILMNEGVVEHVNNIKARLFCQTRMASGTIHRLCLLYFGVLLYYFCSAKQKVENNRAATTLHLRSRKWPNLFIRAFG